MSPMAAAAALAAAAAVAATTAALGVRLPSSPTSRGAATAAGSGGSRTSAAAAARPGPHSTPAVVHARSSGGEVGVPPSSSGTGRHHCSTGKDGGPTTSPCTTSPAPQVRCPQDQEQQQPASAGPSGHAPAAAGTPPLARAPLTVWSRTSAPWKRSDIRWSCPKHAFTLNQASHHSQGLGLQNQVVWCD